MKIKASVAILVLGVTVAMVIVFRHDFVLAFSLFRRQLTPPLAGGIIVLTFFHFASEPLRWWLILKKHRDDFSLLSIYHTVTATALISYAFPVHFGLPARLLMANRILGLDYAAAGALLVIDSFFLYGAWITAGAAGVFMLIPQGGPGFPAALTGIITACVIGAVLLAWCGRQDWQGFPRTAGAIRRFSSGLRMLSWEAAAGNTLLLGADIFIYGLRHTLILSALGVDCSLLKVTLITAVSIFAGFASLMPMGLGGYDFSLIFLLTLIGVPREVALTVPLINRITMVSGVALLGSLSAGRLGLTWHKLQDMKKSESAAAAKDKA